MKLSKQEFKWMNNGLRRFIQRKVEFPTFQKMGLNETGQDILEIGCGSGYGAYLLQSLNPLSYTGIDIMPEQIALAESRGLKNCQFNVQDANDLESFDDESKDIIVIFGILHHIPDWKGVINEIGRILRPGGKFFVTEPDFTIYHKMAKKWDKLMKWEHPIAFSLEEMEKHFHDSGFEIEKKKSSLFSSFGYYTTVKQAMA